MKKENNENVEKNLYEFACDVKGADLDTLQDLILASADPDADELRKFIKDKPLKEQEEMIASMKKAKQEAIERLKAKKAAWEAEKEKNNGAGTNV